MASGLNDPTSAEFKEMIDWYINNPDTLHFQLEDIKRSEDSYTAKKQYLEENIASSEKYIKQIQEKLNETALRIVYHYHHY